MKQLIQFFKDKIGYRDSKCPSPKEVGLPVIYRGERYLLLPFVSVPTLHKHTFSDKYEYLKNRYSIEGISNFKASELLYDFGYVDGLYSDNLNAKYPELRITDISKVCTIESRQECGHTNYNLFFNNTELGWWLGYYDDDASGTFSGTFKAFWELSLFCSCDAEENAKKTVPTEQDIHDAIFWVVKNAYDCKQNPYFNFAGNHFDMPEAITYMLKVAKEQVTACGDAMKWANARIVETVDVPYEEDENIRPATARAHGFEPKQLVYMKAAHEYYLAHVVFCGHPCKSYPKLLKKCFDVDKIFSLAQRYPRSYWQTCSFEEAHDKGVRDAVPLLD